MTDIIRNVTSMALEPTRFHHPLADLDIGDGFEVPLEKWESARACAYSASKKLKRYFRTKKLKSGVVLVYRWA